MKSLREIIYFNKCEALQEKAERMAEHRRQYQKYVLQAESLLEAPQDQREITMLAESLAMEDFFIPPHFITKIHCKNCGWMLIDYQPGLEGKEVVACVWCHTEAGKIIADVLEEIRADEQADRLKVIGK